MVDSPPGWVDSVGDGCDVYASDPQRLCGMLARFYENDGLTAQQACVACGGGTAAATGPEAAVAASTVAPTAGGSSLFSSSSRADEDEDQDESDVVSVVDEDDRERIDFPPGWTDAMGDGCDWYAEHPDGCTQFGGDFANQGYTANEACVVCGGGGGR